MSATEGTMLEYRPRTRDRLRWWWHRVRHPYRIERDSNLYAHAKRELAFLRGDEDDEMQDAIERHVLALVKEFAKEGHSGSSAAYTVSVLEKILRFEPITPLTGDESEWADPFDYEGSCQNVRCGRVFRRPDGTAYDTEAVVFREPDGCCYTSRDSHGDITFPYIPKTEYQDVEAET